MPGLVLILSPGSPFVVSYKNVIHLQGGELRTGGATEQVAETGQTMTCPGPGEELLDCQRLVPMYQCRD